MGDFEKATRPEPVEAAPGGARRFALVLDEQWRVGEKMHGGYLLAVMARAGVEAVTGGSPLRPDHTCPQAVTGTFLRAPAPGPATIEVDLLRVGQGASQVRARLAQEEILCVEAALTLGPPPDRAAGTAADRSPPPEPLAAFDRCPRSPADSGDGRGALPLMAVVDTRLDPSTTGFLARRPTGRGRVSGWLALDTGESWDPLSLLVALDVLPPATFDLGIYGWSPTMSLTAHVHAAPSPGPLRAAQWVDHLGGDRMHETCWVWDADDRLVGQATQLAAVRR